MLMFLFIKIIKLYNASKNYKDKIYITKITKIRLILQR